MSSGRPRRPLWHGTLLLLLGMLTGLVDARFTNVRMRLAAAWGTVGLSPVTAEKLLAAGERAASWQEALVLAGFVSVGLAMLCAAALILRGLGGRSAP